MMADLGAGEVTTTEVAMRAFGLRGNGSPDDLDHARRCVTARMSWMRRFGLVEKGELAGEWSVSAIGEALRKGRLASSVQGGIDRAGPDSVLSLANVVGEKLTRVHPVHRTAMRRELEYHIKRGK